MSLSAQSRVLRYSKRPSLSTISSVEGLDSSKPDQVRGLELSPYTGGASNRNSVVSPLESQQFSASTKGELGQEFPIHSSAVRRQDELSPHQSNTAATQMSKAYQSQFEEELPRSPTRLQTSSTFASSTLDSKIFNKQDCEARSMDDKGTFLQTEWMSMLLDLDEVPAHYNFFAAFSTWIILAAYLVLPGTFTTLKRSEALNPTPGKPESQFDNITHAIANGVDHIGLAAVSALFAGCGAVIVFMLWAKKYNNYLWLCTRLFVPVMLNSFAGLLTTLVAVYTAQNGVWSITATINAIISGSVAGVASVVYGIYNFVLLRRIKKEHKKQYPDIDGMPNPMVRMSTRRMFMTMRKKLARPAV